MNDPAAFEIEHELPEEPHTDGTALIDASALVSTDGRAVLVPVDGTEWDEQRRVDGIRFDLPNPLDLRAAVHALVAAREDDELPEGSAGTDIDRGTPPAVAAHPDAAPSLLAIKPTVDSDPPRSLIPSLDTSPRQAAPDPAHHGHALVAGGPSLLRDRIALLEIARYRILPLQDLRRQVFQNRNAAVVTRRMQALAKAGFLTVWEELLVQGGHPRHALLTRRGLAWAIAELKAEAARTPHERLVTFMAGETAKKPLELLPATAPPFLPHQLETNHVVAALARIPALGVTWSSTWHRPFPNALDRIAMPQPDAVLVAMRDGEPHLVFLEHDRGQEAPASFAAKKAERYSALALYGLTEQLFGFADFTVWVTVNDVAGRRPLDRIRVLQDVSRASDMLRFTLAGWIPAHAQTQPIWFTPTTSITAKAHRPDAHAELVGPFATSIDQDAIDPAATLLRRMRAEDHARTAQ
jgi:hypothetical protein